MRQHVDAARALEDLGLTTAEAQAYQVLVAGGALSASEVAERSGLPRSSVYPVLRSLVDEGLAQAGAGYGSRFQALPPAEALAALVGRQRAELAERERRLGEVVKALATLANSSAEGDREELVEVLQTPHVVGGRFERLQLSTSADVHMFVKAPILVTRDGNPSQAKMMAAGVRYHGLYEQDVLTDPEVGPHLQEWADAGEQSRVYPGTLPLKIAIFDRRAVLMPLNTPGRGGGVTSVLIRHEALGSALAMLFDALWEKSRPLPAAGAPRRPTRRRGSAPRSDQGRR